MVEVLRSPEGAPTACAQRHTQMQEGFRSAMKSETIE